MVIFGPSAAGRRIEAAGVRGGGLRPVFAFQCFAARVYTLRTRALRVCFFLSGKSGSPSPSPLLLAIRPSPKRLL